MKPITSNVLSPFEFKIDYKFYKLTKKQAEELCNRITSTLEDYISQVKNKSFEEVMISLISHNTKKKK